MDLICKYLNGVRQFTASLKSEYGVENILIAKRRRVIPLEGTTKDGLFKFSFHGIGCCAECADFTVDFDFGDDGSIEGFDAFRLARFASTLKEFETTPPTESEIRDALRSLVAQGFVIEPRLEPSPHLFYLQEEKPT